MANDKTQPLMAFPDAGPSSTIAQMVAPCRV